MNIKDIEDKAKSMGAETYRFAWNPGTVMIIFGASGNLSEVRLAVTEKHFALNRNLVVTSENFLQVGKNYTKAHQFIQECQLTPAECVVTHVD